MALGKYYEGIVEARRANGAAIVFAPPLAPPAASNEPGRRMCHFKDYARFGALPITAPSTQLKLLRA